MKKLPIFLDEQGNPKIYKESPPVVYTNASLYQEARVYTNEQFSVESVEARIIECDD